MSVRTGTTLISLAVSEGVVMVADDMVYKLEKGLAVPAERNVRKVFAMGSIVIGTAQLLRCKQSLAVSADGERHETVSIEYKFEDWIVDFIRGERGRANYDPESIAQALDAKMRQTLKPIEVFLENGDWGDHSPNDRVVTYVVAGYAKNFKNYALFELGAEINSEGKGLRYVAPFAHQRHSPHEYYLGEDQFLMRAADGLDPQVGVFRNLIEEFRGSVGRTLPNFPKSLQERAAIAVSLIKVEAQFNSDKVGNVVTAAVLDRVGRRFHLATF